MIVTFYSYKGGVGRSMALANLGEWFRLQGLRVVLVDWDLEAPGLESFFVAEPAEREAIRARMGVLDLIASYKEVYPSLARGAAQARDRPGGAIEHRVAMFADALPPVAHMLVAIKPAPKAPRSAGKLWLLTAGCRSEKRFDAYAHSVQQFDWEEFYAAYDGEAYFEWLRRQLLDPALADVVLIDSRTGVAEMSGVCTRQLADVVVMFSAPNDQNLEGVAMMARSFTRPDLLAARGGRRIDLVAVPARVDVSEGRPIDLFEERFRAKLDAFVPETFKRLHTSFARLRVPYISAYAYAERLAIGDPEGVKSLQEAYTTLAAHLVALAPATSAVRRVCRQALQATFGLPTIFVAVLDPADATFAADLQRRLDSAGVITSLEQRPADGVLDAAIRSAALSQGSVSVLIAVSASTLAAPRLALLVRRARAHGVCLFPVIDTIDASAGPPPRWARRTPIYGATRDWDALVPLLQSPCRSQRAPFMAPPVPDRFVGRAQEIARIKALLLGDEDRERPIALVGLGGVGKSTLARVICSDEDIIDRYDDGILWIKLGAQPDLTKELAGVLAAFGEDAQPVSNAEQAERRLAELLGSRSCLLVVDDATASSQLRNLPRGAPGVRILFTTRTRDVAAESGASVIEIGPLTQYAAAATLAADITGVPLDPALVGRLADELGGLPLALELANQGLRKRIELGDSPAAALADLVQRIEEEGLSAVDPGLFNDPGRSVFASFALAAERLEPEDRARLPLLARLDRNRASTAADVALACAISEADAQRLMRRMAAVSLFDLDPGTGSVRIPPPVHAFLRSMEHRQRRAESTRIAAQAAPASETGTMRPTTGADATPQSAPGPRVWISYRREDTVHAGRLYDRLSRELGYDRIFMDIANVEPGQDFRRSIEQAVSAAAVLVVVIGPQWARIVDHQGRRRIDNPDDFVRLEIATALEKNLRVIPVLVGGAWMPSSDELPQPLAALARRQALEISDTRFQQDADELVRAVGLASAGESAASAPSPGVAAAKRMPLGIIASILIGALALGAGLFWYWPASEAPPIDSLEAQALFAQAEDRYFGRNVPQDYAVAALLYQKAAELGFAPAKNSLGRAYENGQGVEKDLEQAIFWYQEAAKLGHPDAIAALQRLRPGALR